MSTTHYCYVIEAGSFVKIGYSNNMDKRKETLQTASPHEIMVICLFPYKEKSAAMEMEAHLHSKLNKHRIRGEWFSKYPVLGFLKSNGKQCKNRST